MPASGRRLHSGGFVLAALLLAVVSVVVIDGAMRFADDARALQRSQAAINALGNLLSNQRDAISALNGYMLGLGDDQRSRHLRAVERLQIDLQALQGMVAQGTVRAEDVATLREKIAARVALAELMRRQFESDGAAAASALARNGGAAAHDAAIEQAIATLSEAQTADLQRQAQSFKRSSQQLLVAASLGIPISLLILGAIYLILRQQIDTRVVAERSAAESHRELNQSALKMGEVSRNMQRLSAYASLLQTSENTDEALEITKVSLSALLPDCGGSVYLRAAEGEELNLTIDWNEHWASSRNELLAHDCWAVRRSQPFASEPSTAQLRCHHIQPGGRAAEASTWCFPLFAQGEFLGLLYMSGPAGVEGQELAENAAEQLSLALANLRMRQQLRDQSIRDPLTGLFNRRYLDESLTREQGRCQRKTAPLSVLMLDVDHFKKFNDTHGHGGGDALLSAVGGLLRKISRATDIPCRYGGEEFTVILPETDAMAAAGVADKIRSAIAEMQVMHEGRALSRVTASLGVACLPVAEGSLDALMESADAALYRAKQAGRNRVELASDASTTPVPAA